MEWTDTAIVLGLHRHGEGNAILDVLTSSRGRWRGYVQGGGSSRQRGIYEPGNRVQVSWKARIEDQLGHFTAELLDAHAAVIIEKRDSLALLSSLTGLLAATLHERDDNVAIYEGVEGFVTLLALHPDLVTGASALVKLELGLLSELGFGLDLSHCAGTGTTEDLVYVSPKSGKAVSKAAGAIYHEKLLSLPAFLTGGAAADLAGVRDGLTLTGFFLERYVLLPKGKTLPEARARMLDRLQAKVRF